MMRSDINGMFSTLDRFCAKSGCIGAVRDYSSQHFLTEAGDYTAEAAKAMAEKTNPCQCSAAAAAEDGGWRSRSWGSQGNDLSAAMRFKDIVHETGERYNRTAVWPFMAASKGLHDLHPGVRYLTVESADPETREAFSKRLAAWEARHSAARFREAGDAAVDAGVRVKYTCDCTHWCYEAMASRRGLLPLTRALRSAACSEAQRSCDLQADDPESASTMLR